MRVARLRRPFGLWLAFALIVGGMAHRQSAPPATIAAGLGLETEVGASAAPHQRPTAANGALAKRCQD